MSQDLENYHLDLHAACILEEYCRLKPMFEEIAARVHDRLKKVFDDAGILTAGLEYRVKSEASLAGKLELKGAKYKDIFDLTDIVGLRVITFYSDDVDKVASIMERLFDIDWENSVDKRKAHEIDSFGYLSLHYICSLSEEDRPAQWPEASRVRFEIQMRTVLQHAWANMNHDTGYKSGVEVPNRYLRNLSRLAGILELVDEQFSQIRTEITDYRRNIQSLVASGNLKEVPLDGDSFRSYLAMEPFQPLNRRIAAVNQAEILNVSLMPFLQVFRALKMDNLGDIADLIRDWSDAAYQIAVYQMGVTDIDIVSSSVGPQNLCIAYILRNGGGKTGIRMLLDELNGESDTNDYMAEYLVSQAKDLPFMNQ